MEMTEPLVLIFTLSGQGEAVNTRATLETAPGPPLGPPHTLEMLARSHPPSDVDRSGAVVDAALEGGILARCHRHAVRVDGDDGALQTCRDKGTGKPRGHPWPPFPSSVLYRPVATLTVAGAVMGGDGDSDGGLAGDTAHVCPAHVLPRIGHREL